MGHRASREFFDEKKPWSVRKDEILAYYLAPYLPKVATLGKPIVIVDGFAGPGRFNTGEAGSPVIIAQTIQRFLTAQPRVDCSELCVERDPLLHRLLEDSLRGFGFTRAVGTSFLEFLPEVEALASSASVFIYADPFAIDGLEWAAMDRVFRLIHGGASVELLLNFNAPAFVRRARAALALGDAADDPLDDDDPSQDVPGSALDRAVGGTWWRSIVKPAGSFALEVDAVAEELSKRLRRRFGEAGMYPIRARLADGIPKYFLIYATRHPDGLVLINEAVCKDLHREHARRGPVQALLFEPNPQALPSSDALLRPALLTLLRDGMTRRELQVEATRALFGQFRERQVLGEIARLISEGRVRAVREKSRMNDRTRLFRV